MNVRRADPVVDAAEPGRDGYGGIDDPLRAAARLAALAIAHGVGGRGGRLGDDGGDRVAGALPRVASPRRHDVATYDVATYDVATYDVATYDVATYDVATYDVATYDVVQ